MLCRMTILHYIFCIADHPIIVIGIIKIISFLIITYQQHTVLVGYPGKLAAAAP